MNAGEGRSILTVGRNRQNVDLLAELLGRQGYDVLRATSLEEFDEALANSRRIGLALVDVSGFQQEVLERFDELTIHKVPLFVLAPKPSTGLEQEVRGHGALGVLVKPITKTVLLEVVRSQMPYPTPWEAVRE